MFLFLSIICFCAFSTSRSDKDSKPDLDFGSQGHLVAVSEWREGIKLGVWNGSVNKRLEELEYNEVSQVQWCHARFLDIWVLRYFELKTDYWKKKFFEDWKELVEMFNLPADCNAVDIGANDGGKWFFCLFVSQLYLIQRRHNLQPGNFSWWQGSCIWDGSNLSIVGAEHQVNRIFLEQKVQGFL